jgi:DNA primase
MSRQALDELKQQIPLLDDLQAQDWQPARRLSRGRWMGLYLHSDHKPSFLVDPSKSLFYCYGCGRGGDVIRFAELYHQVKFPQAVALLHHWRGWAPLLQEAAEFYRMQLHRHGEAMAYLHQRGVRSPELIEHMRIGYAPGGGGHEPDGGGGGQALDSVLPDEDKTRTNKADAGNDLRGDTGRVENDEAGRENIYEAVL